MYQILLVDDEALIREGVSENVPWEQYGYKLAGSCENGKEALEFIDKNEVDVVLTDICMPYMDGMQLSEELHEHYPDIKIIILSGYDEFEYAKRAIKYNVKEYLLKPITAMEMGEVLKKLKVELDSEREKENDLSQMKNNYYKGQMLLHSDALLNLIIGSKTEAESRKELETLGISIEAASYRVAVVELDIYAKADKLNEDVKKESALMAFVLYNISQEIVKQNQSGEVCQGKDHRTFILFHTNKPVEFRQTVKNICDEIIKQMNNMMQLAVNIGLGNYTTSMKDIYLSYEEAEEALEYHYVLGGNNIMEIDVIRSEKEEADIEKILNRIILHMKENDGRKVEEDLQIMEDVFRDYTYDRRSIGTILQRVIDAIDDMIKISEVEEIPETFKKEQILKSVLEACGLEEAIEILNAYCMEILSCLDNRKNIGGKKYAVLALDYIEKNYADCDLSLQSVCAYLNISTSRFSTIFKASTGTTFMEAVINTRMQKAKDLLTNTDLKNYEIADKVGFNDPHYFSIAFKKVTGKTPTEFSKEKRQ